MAPLTGYGQAVLDEPIPKKVPFRGSQGPTTTSKTRDYPLGVFESLYPGLTSNKISDPAIAQVRTSVKELIEDILTTDKAGGPLDVIGLDV